MDPHQTTSREDKTAYKHGDYRQRSPRPERRAPSARERDRSRSPTQIDRYQPGHDRDNRRIPRRENSGHGVRWGTPGSASNIDRYVPGEQRTPLRPVLQNSVRDPLLEPTQVGFSHFSEWWREEQDLKRQRERHVAGRRASPGPKQSFEELKPRIQAAYDEYRLEYSVKAAKAFVQAHKNEAWFRERYVPEVRGFIRAKIAAYRAELFDVWSADLENGMFDDFSLEGVYKGATDGPGVTSKGDGETSESLTVGDLLPVKGADLQDPMAYTPALLIKTITPGASRDTLEAFCMEKLGTAEGGLKWLSLSDPNVHKRCHRLGWVLLNPAQASADDTVRQNQADSADDDTAMTMNDNEDDKILDKALQALDNQVMSDPDTGDFTLHVGIHRTTPNQRKKALWDLFSAPERVYADLQLAIRLVEKLDEQLQPQQRGVPLVEQRIDDLVGKGNLQPPIVSAMSTNGASFDSAMDDVEEGEDVESRCAEVDDEEMLITKKKLDLLVEYLRRVHHCCFYCVFEADSVLELQRKCAAGHLRRPRGSLTPAARAVAKATVCSHNDIHNNNDHDPSPVEDKKPRQINGKSQLAKASNWVKSFEDKLRQWLEPEKVDVKKLGGVPLADGLEKDLAQYVKQEDESKFRCKVPECSKLFKGIDFWRKHVEKRHVEWFEKVKQEIQLLNDYVLDPARVMQGRTDAASNGHFPAPREGLNGTPRNFNSPYRNGLTPGGFPGRRAGMLSMSGSPAPNRDGTPRSGSRANYTHVAGPHDRTMPRRSIGNGMQPSGQFSPPGRPPFVEGGLGTFSTSAAMDGRSVKSYNDLDASAGVSKDADALDY